MNIEYIIVQAGGKGTRLQELTKNKPKALCPIDNLPMIFHLFKKFPDKKFIIIGDYMADVLEKYLEVFCEVEYLTVRADGTGTCSGIKNALNYINKNKPFMLIWSDLVIGDMIDINNLDDNNYIGISKEFECRWSYKDNKFIEEKSMENGVSGLFIFENKELIKDVPTSGEFVKWLKNRNFKFERLNLCGTKEFGTLSVINQISSDSFRCRPFNKIEVKSDRIIKRAVNEQGEKLSKNELNWYKEIQELGFKQIPKIYNFNPFEMERVDGDNIFKTNLSIKDKKKVIDNLVEALNNLHSLKNKEVDIYSIYDTYYKKTIDRIEKVRDLIPLTKNRIIKINGKECKNIFYYKNEFKKKVSEMLYDTKFCIIHGDCTFSNILIDKELKVTFIDPRGYFGNVKMFGDIYYDWAKLYYSIFGDYDQFNNKKFNLNIYSHEVTVDIETNGWREVEEYYLEKIIDCNKDKIKFIHAIIWLSLSTYAWEDYDSICAAFYNGLYYLNDFLDDTL